ncbi:3-dehydroquinate synthase [Acetivibrio mesophilus]|uniref:3-dehydroquinate synthase n=1 Tax=Acetivibrio mesophilus TaxID=2487273 RepID=A0A4Q0I2L6_9FIRM|nr:3-dehydroquinate synthase [Acetivibrio mesophilus]ODM25366.1 3-dehydroquinate synthase [Clostridium sp. Bc-iso-3]RXE58446.1 3-dehydroquinate synthase [Acetivibrio mesophilus]HHV28669.1 3-dehydroquinate synthase [Clostridium sp.]
MLKLNVNLQDRSYPIYINTDYAQIDKCIHSARLTGKLVLITDTNVDRYQAQECEKAFFEAGYEISKFAIPAGEENKNLETVRDIYKYLLSLKLDRSATLIALGGGVVGDITGFAAATFLRGINFVQIPTTLLAQSDSSVGGKVGVDFEGSKNIVGAFYQPKFVYINVNSLKTLPERELRSGLAEVVKHGIIMDDEFYEYIDYNVHKIFNYDESVLQYIAKKNCSIKASVVEKDEKEGDLRAILNFGHTIGHAIETVMDFSLLHGECVSLGIIGAMRMSQYLEMIDEHTVNRVKGTLEKIGLPTRLEGIDVDSVYRQMFYDKKIKGNKLTFVLPRKKIGEVIQCTIDDEDLIKRVIASLGEEE